jgi:hypothetical protein
VKPPSTPVLCGMWCFSGAMNVAAFVLGGSWLFGALALVCMFMAGRRSSEVA